MGRIFRIVMDCHMGCPLSPDLPLANMIDEGFRGFIIRPLNLQLQAMTGGQQDRVGADFNVELVNAIRC